MARGTIKDPSPPTVINAKPQFPPAQGGKIPRNPGAITFGVLEYDGEDYLYFDDPGNNRNVGEEIDFDFAVFPSGFKIAVNLR